MKKVLIVSYHFPPLQTIGAQRPYKVAKYFPKYGWEPIVLTIKHTGKLPEEIRIIETDYKNIIDEIKLKIGFNLDDLVHEQLGLKVTKNYKPSTLKGKTIKLLKDIILFPDEQKGWYKFAIKSAFEFLNEERVDAIISTSYPVISHVIARKLKQRYNIPWVADLRDLWWQNPYYNRSFFIKYLHWRLELKTLSNVDGLVTVTRPWVDTLKILHKNKKIFCITNGFDSEDFTSLPSGLNTKFTLTYTGTLHNGKRDPVLLFKVVEQLIAENKINSDLIDIRFFVPQEDWLIEDIKKYKLEGVVSTYGFIPRDEVLVKQRESQILLLLLWDNDSEEGFCPGKVYEYLGARRPIIAIGGKKHIVKNILERAEAGRYTWNVNTLRTALLEYYQEFVESGKIECHSNKYVNNFTYNVITKKYSEVLDSL